MPRSRRGRFRRQCLRNLRADPHLPVGGILQTVSAKSPQVSAPPFSLPWSQWVQLLRRARFENALAFDHAELFRDGRSGRALQRQIGSRFYEPTLRARKRIASPRAVPRRHRLESGQLQLGR